MMRRDTTLGGLLVAVSMMMACGPSAPGSKIPGDEGRPGATAPKAPSGDAPLGEEQRVGAAKLVDTRSHTALAADNLDQVKTTAPPPKTSAEIYKAVAPATVVVRVAGGIGSGVVIDPAGWVLTNHHVIASGAVEDFKYEATILLGKLSKQTGAMERRDEQYKAEVYKADKLRDIALLKIVDPPDDLPSVRIAEDNPAPGSEVVALGHAGAGMLWALKSGQISALGKLSEALAQLASFKDDEEGQKAADAFRRFMDGQNLGLIIQSTVNVLPGDSGGPLLNERGELVGLNVFSRKDPKTGGLLSFHVHRDELATFVKDRPARPAQLVPDPWLEGGGDMSLEDADLDGKVDVLLLQGRKPCAFCPVQSTAVFIDADQNSFDERPIPKDLNALYEARGFDAEAVYLQIEKDVFVWYDTDDDGTFDRLLYDEGTTGLVSSGYAIGKDGSLDRREDLSRTKPFQAGLFTSDGLDERFARITHAAFPARYTDAPEPMASTLPDPIGRAGHSIAGDLDEDGTLDAVQTTNPFSKRLLIDTDQTTIAPLGPIFELSEVDRTKIDPEIAVVSQSTHMWIFYDRDDDGRFDLVLHTPGTRVYAATDAWTIDAGGKKTPAPEHVGRMLFRPALLDATQGPRLTKMVQNGLLAIMSAEDDGLGSFPHPIDDHRGTSVEIMELPVAKRAVITLIGYGSDGYLLDLDQSSGLFGAKDAIDIQKRVEDGKIDAEFAYFHRNGIAWAYYDTDTTPGYDVVLVSLTPSRGTVDAGFSISGAQATHDPSLSGGRLVRPSLFRSVLLKQRLTKLASDLFADDMVEGR